MRDIHNVRSKTDPSHVTKGCQIWAVAQCTIHASQMKTFKKIYQIHYIQYSLSFSTCCQIYHTLHMLLNNVNDLLCLQLVSSEFFIDIILPAGLWPRGGFNLLTEMSTRKMRSALFWTITQHILVILYRCFWTAHWSHFLDP